MATTVCASNVPVPVPSNGTTTVSAPRLLVSPPLMESPSTPPTIIPTTHPDSSDCGSSSGVGGMKGTSHEPVSSDEASSSSEQTPGAVFVAHGSGVSGASVGGGGGTGGGPPSTAIPPPGLFPHHQHPNNHRRTSSHGYNNNSRPTSSLLYASPLSNPNGLNTDLFVHIQMGETLSIVVGNDAQQITGPATVRMVGQYGASLKALPIHVPPGHMIHQICDEQGNLRHLILSPEAPSVNVRLAPPSTSSTATTSGCNGTGPRNNNGVPQSASNHQHQFYTYNRNKWPRTVSHSPKNTVTEAATSPTDPLLNDIDQEDYERIRDMLNRILPPTIIRLTPNECELAWQELDTSEASSLGGPFPQLDASEFSYQVIVSDTYRNRIVNSQRITARDSERSRCRVTRLIPNKEYRVVIKASLEERGIQGESSPPLLFTTPSSRPDAPVNLKHDGVGSNWVNLRWSPPERDNGSPIVGYSLYQCRTKEDGEDALDLLLETQQPMARIQPLIPSTQYRLKVTASNKRGESLPAVVSFTTRAEIAPFLPTVTQTNSKGVKVSWPTVPECLYTAEMIDRNNTVILKKCSPISFIHVSDLQPGVDYGFRVHAQTTDGEMFSTDLIHYRMNPALKDRQDRMMPAPMKPYVITPARDHKRLELGFRSNVRDVIFNLEGSATMPVNMPPMWKNVYRGTATSCTVADPELSVFRVQIIAKRNNQQSDWSEVLFVNVKPRVPGMQVPSFINITKHSIEIDWQLPQIVVPVNATLIFDLRRIDGVSQLIYSGPQTSFVLESLRPRQHISVQVRAVVVDSMGCRTEGEWSGIGQACTTRDAPSPPHSIRVSEDRRELSWSVMDDVCDVTFVVTRHQVFNDGSQSEAIVVETPSNRMSLADLLPGTTYTFQIMTTCAWGQSAPSEVFRATTAAEVPGAPEGVTADADAQCALCIRWLAPDCRGSPLRAYHVKVERAKQIVRERNISASSSSSAGETELHFDDLEPDTTYRLSVAAQNDVGVGAAASVEAKTKRAPPPPPSLDCDAEPTQLKLKWRSPITAASSSSGPLVYRVVRLNESNDSHIPVYEGEYCTAKIKSLQESTKYRFQIRCYDRETGSGPWSEIFSFSTPLAPPPAIKSAPTSTNNGGGLHQVEWTSVIPKGNPRGLFYRLQTHDNDKERGVWNTAYEGATPSFSIRVPNESSIQVRVFVVRPDGQNNLNLTSQPSPPAHLSTIGETVEENKKEIDAEAENNNEIPFIAFITTALRDHSLAIIVMIVFVILSLSTTVFIDAIMELLGFSSNSPSTSSPYIPSDVL